MGVILGRQLLDQYFDIDNIKKEKRKIREIERTNSTIKWKTYGTIKLLGLWLFRFHDAIGGLLCISFETMIS